MENYENKDTGIFHFGIDESAKANILESARWGKFIAIVGFVLLALGLIFAIAIRSTYNNLAASMGAGIPMGDYLMWGTIIMTIICFFPNYFLFKFCTEVKPALHQTNQDQFNEGMTYLKKMFKFIGILLLIFICFYAIVILFVIITGVFSSL